jgi:mRNA interferase RelE/StbE
MYQLLVRSSAEKDIRRLSRVMQRRVRTSIEALRESPRRHGAQKLVSDFRWKIRVGDYRVLYEIDDANRVVTIDRVRHRREVYR